ncbi:site-specific integrase [Comamonas terrigena]|uniref:site-specific integrase n=1 Tax=Comamonas terrigena TaxID=32013 RepID=UPI0028B05467|nr:site-specific integrase [Comamonas terrigena]
MNSQNRQSIMEKLIPFDSSVIKSDPHKIEIEKSLHGESFIIHSDRWKISSKVTLSIDKIINRLSPDMHEGAIRTLCHFARNKSPNTCIAIVFSILDYSKSIFSDNVINKWVVSDFYNYRENLMNRFQHENYLIVLRTFLKTWYELRYPGISSEAYVVLDSMRLKRTEIGRAVRTMDPHKGPLEPSEFQSLTKDIYAAYEKGIISTEQFSVSVFHIASGRRPIQTSAIKCKDVESIKESASKDLSLLIHVPRAKQVGATFRDEFRSIEWTPELFSIFRMQQRITQLELAAAIEKSDWELQPQDIAAIQANLPLFPDWRKVQTSLDFCTSLRKGGEHSLALDKLRSDSEGSLWHRRSQSITSMLQAAAKSAGSKSRTGELLGITSQRLRHTKGTNLAREGLGTDIIAWLLDHSTLEAAKIYIDNLPEHAIPVNSAMALSPTMQNLAQLFRGKIVDSEEDAIAGETPQTSRIHFKGKSAATCSTRKSCGMGTRIPLCCYECDHFQPWLDGPHMEVLTELLEERHQREIELGADHPVTKAADSTIVAVINVIQLCEIRHQNLRSDNK